MLSTSITSIEKCYTSQLEPVRDGKKGTSDGPTLSAGRAGF